MGRLLVFIILIAAAVLIWKAFGPSSWQSRQRPKNEPPTIKGPDDDPEFLWKLEKEQYLRRKEQQRRKEEQNKDENKRREQHREQLWDESQDSDEDNP